VVVTADKNWSGKPVTRMAKSNAERLQKWMKTINPSLAEAALYNRRGVFAVNENNWAAARQDFLRAYSLDPSDAFSLNNRGYVAEMDGDLESARYFYQKAQQASGADARVGSATQLAEKGERLSRLAAGSTDNVNGALTVFSQRRHVETGPIELTPRNGAPPTPPATAAPQAPNSTGRPH
jgi:tetratricopeptide (TPR) repeat protein